MYQNVNIEEAPFACFPTHFGNFKLYAFKNTFDGTEHLALTTENIKNVPLVRVHSECITGEVFQSLRCDCGSQLKKAQQLISESKNGILVYIRNHEGRGIGLTNKIRAYALQDQGFDTVSANHYLGFNADLRNYSIGAAILKKLGVKTVALLTNNPDKLKDLESRDIKVIERIPLQVPLTKFNEKYLRTKKEKLNHFLEL